MSALHDTCPISLLPQKAQGLDQGQALTQQDKGQALTQGDQGQGQGLLPQQDKGQGQGQGLIPQQDKGQGQGLLSHEDEGQGSPIIDKNGSPLVDTTGSPLIEESYSPILLVDDLPSIAQFARAGDPPALVLL